MGRRNTRRERLTLIASAGHDGVCDGSAVKGSELARLQSKSPDGSFRKRSQRFNFLVGGHDRSDNCLRSGRILFGDIIHYARWRSSLQALRRHKYNLTICHSPNMTWPRAFFHASQDRSLSRGFDGVGGNLAGRSITAALRGWPHIVIARSQPPAGRKRDSAKGTMGSAQAPRSRWRKRYVCSSSPPPARNGTPAKGRWGAVNATRHHLRKDMAVGPLPPAP
jgi:hypothetical protein